MVEKQLDGGGTDLSEYFKTNNLTCYSRFHYEFASYPGLDSVNIFYIRITFSEQSLIVSGLQF